MNVRTHRRGIWILVSIIVGMTLSSPGFADVLDPFDNMPMPEGSSLIGTYVFYQDLPTYDDEVAGDVDIDVKIPGLIFRPLWFGPKLAEKFSWGLNAIVPLLNVDAAGLDSQSGLGDIAVSPFIFLVENGPFNVSFWEFIYTPTGRYDENNPDTSPGLDTWQFQHQLAVGYYPSQFGLDWTINYWNRLESDKLNIDYQDAIETDLILHYTFENKLTFGGIGSFWWDVDELKIDGQEVANTKGHRYAAGINIMYPFAENVILSGRWTNDFDVENHTKGDWYYLRFAFLF